MQQDTVLRAEDLCKSYVKGVLVNDHVSLSLGRGEIFGLLGPNGAGKTTFVKQVIGLAKPDSGRIAIDGVDVVANPGYARQACSFQAQVQAPISGLSTLEAIELAGQIRGGRYREVHERAMGLIDRLELGEWKKTMGATISGGVRRLVAFCMAAVVPGKVVILDEPTNDVDPLRRRAIWQEVQGLARDGSAVLLVTHNILEAERVVDRLAIMDSGRVISTGTPASLKESAGDAMRLELTLEPRAAAPDFPDFLRHPVVVNRRILGDVSLSHISAAIAWARALKESGAIEEFLLGPATMEDFYIRMVRNPNGTGVKGKSQ